MEFFRIHKTIPFMHYRHVLNAISLASFIVAVYWIFTHGLSLSIEFTGGTQMEVAYPTAANTEQIREDLAAVSKEVLVQNFGTSRDVVIRVPTKEGQTSGQVAAEVMKVLQAKTPDVKLKSTEFVGPQVGDELARDGGTALALADSVNEALGNEYHYVYDRSQVRQKREKKEIGISAVRGGTIVGEHEVIFAGTDEVIEFKHTAYSRGVFAKGAVEAGKFLAGKEAGMYDMGDVIGL